MADLYNVSIILTNVGQDSGPFDVFYSIDGGTSWVPYSTNIPSSSFISGGYFMTGLPEAACRVKIESSLASDCSVSFEMLVLGYPLPCP